MIIAAITAAASPGNDVVIYGGGSLLVVCIGFALALMKQGRAQYKDAIDVADKAENRYIEVAKSHEERVSKLTLQFRGELSDARARCDEQIQQFDKQLKEERRHRQRCDRRFDLLIIACRQHGVPIPEEVWRVD